MKAGAGSQTQFNPFPGLRPFGSDEHHLFFGREAQSAALLQLLRRNRFLAVVGTSGSGKSSLVRAGLVPELHGGTMAQAGSAWEVLVLRPGGRPLENLARTLITAGLYDADDPGTLPRLRATLSRSRFGLVEAVKQSEGIDSETNLLVVVDQFEELFRFRQQDTESEEAAAAFVNLLLTSSAQEERQIFVTLTMRSDYLGDCSKIPGLAEAVNRGEYLIPRLLRDQKRDAIGKPIGVGGAKISSLLVQRLLNEIGDDPDQLPVLQHAMMRMWDVWSQADDRDRPIDFCDLEATGGLANALSCHADEIFEALPDDAHRTACERVFKTLTEKGSDNRGIRRPTRFERLVAITASDRATIAHVLDAFRRPGVTFIMPDVERELTDPTVVDLSHESLMRGWQRLRVWVEEEAQSARIFHRLLDTALLWRDGKAGLFRDPDLQVGLSWRQDERPNEAWAELYGGRLDVAVGFLERSRQEAKAEEEAYEEGRRRELEQARRIAEAERQHAAAERRSAQRLRWLACGIGAVAILAIAAFLFAFAAREEAERSQKVAASRAAEADHARRTLHDQLYIADMNRVGSAYADGRSQQVVELLNAHRPGPGEADSRGFEWYYWWRASHRDVWRYRESAAPIHAMVVSADGKWVCALGWPQRLDVFDVSQRRRINGSTAAVEPTSASLSRDESILAAAGWGETIRLFNTSDWSYLRDLQLPQSADIKVAFSPTDDLLVAGDIGHGAIALWDTVEWKQAIFQIDDVALGSNLAFSPDGSTLALGSRSGKFPVVLWDVRARSVRRRLPGHEEPVVGVAWSPDGRWLASGSWDETVRLWKDGLEPAGSLRAFGPVGFLSFSPDSRCLAATSPKDNAVRVWEMESRGLLCTIRGHRKPVGSVAFVGDSTTLWTASQDGSIKAWDLLDAGSTGTVRLGPEAEGSHPIGVTSSAAGQELLTHRSGSRIRRWELDEPAGDRPTSRPAWDDAREYLAAALSDDGRLLATYTAEGQLWVRDLEGQIPAVERRLEPTWKEPPTKLGVSRDGHVVALARTGNSMSNWALVWDLESGWIRRQESERLDDFSLSADGEKLAGWINLSVVLWSWRRDEAMARTSEVGPARCAAFSPSGSMLAVGYWDNNIYTYSTRFLGRAQILEGHAREVTALAYSPDGSRVASGSMDGTLRIWDADTGELMSTLTGERGTVDWVSFAPDGHSILSTSTDDDGIKIWRRATEAEVAQDTRDVVEILNSDGRSHASHADWLRALAMLGDAIRFRPNEMQLLAWRGDALNRLGRPLEALADYQKAVELGLMEARAIRRAAELTGLRPWVAGSDRQGVTWRYTTEEPGDEESWKMVEFDDTGWSSGVGPFGGFGEPTRWSGQDIWLRHEFKAETLPEEPILFLASIDDSAEIYLNGVLAGMVTRYTGSADYRRLPCAEAARRSLRRGANVMAVHCHNQGGVGRVAVGLYTLDLDADEAMASSLMRALEAGPKTVPLLELRAQLRAKRGDWKGAAADYLSRAELQPHDFEKWMRAATLLVRAGDAARYRELVRSMLTRIIGDPEKVVNAADAEKVAKTGLMLAYPGPLLEQVTQMAHRAESIATTDAQQAWVLPYAQLAVGWAALRNGDPETAITQCEKCLADDSVPARAAQAHFVLALACSRAGDLVKARRALAEGERILESSGNPPDDLLRANWHDWLMCRQLQKEARGLLQPGG